MSDALKLVSDLEAVVVKKMPQVMPILQPPQMAAALAIFSAAKKKDVATVEASAKKLMATMTSDQSKKLEPILGKDLLKRLEAYK